MLKPQASATSGARKFLRQAGEGAASLSASDLPLCRKDADSESTNPILCSIEYRMTSADLDLVVVEEAAAEISSLSQSLPSTFARIWTVWLGPRVRDRT